MKRKIRGKRENFTGRECRDWERERGEERREKRKMRVKRGEFYG